MIFVTSEIENNAYSFDIAIANINFSESVLSATLDSRISFSSNQEIQTKPIYKNINRFWLAREVDGQKIGGTRFKEQKNFASQDSDYISRYGGLVASSKDSDGNLLITVNSEKDEIYMLTFEDSGYLINGIKVGKTAYTFGHNGDTFIISTDDGSSAKLLSINVLNVLELDHSDILSMDFDEQIASENENLEFGLFESVLNLEINDPNGVFSAAKDSLYDKKVIVKKYRHTRERSGDSFVKKMVLIGQDEFTITNVESNHDLSFKITAKDEIEKIKSKRNESLELSENSTLKTFIDHLIPNNNYDLIINGVVDYDKEYLTRISLPSSYLSAGMVYDSLKKCCEVGMFNISYSNGRYKLWKIV